MAIAPIRFPSRTAEPSLTTIASVDDHGQTDSTLDTSASSTRPTLASGQALLPPTPRSVDATGSSRVMLSELLLKVMLQHGLQHLQDLSQHLKLTPIVVDELVQSLRREMLIEMRRRGTTDADAAFELTQAGRARAQDALARSHYTGPAPVTLDSYLVQVQLQSVSRMPVGKDALARALQGVVLDDGIREQLGSALNSGRASMLYGPPGGGKSYLCHKLAGVLTGPIAVPHAIDVAGEVVRVFDPLVHHPVQTPSNGRGVGLKTSAIDLADRGDERWVVCSRPVVITGGELTLEMLDLVHDERAGYYQAPPHVKANNGIFLIDDLGRQLVTPRQLLNRWIVPMESKHDYLKLRNGNKFCLPFDTMLFFSTNLAPSDVADEAFLRRIGYKIYIGELPLDRYRKVFDDVCAELGLPYDADAFERLIDGYHRPHARPLLACYPRDLLRQIVDHATYHGKRAVLDAPMLDWAWHNYFATRNEARAVSISSSPSGSSS